MWRYLSQKTKIFCVGFNKTGTTSTAVALAELGFNVAPQAPAEMLIKDWGQRKFDRILDFCGQFDAFQDIPFSLPYTFIALDLAFPNSKFVLTIRDSPEMWFESLHRYHCNLFSFDKTINWSDLEKAEYCYKGWIAETHKLIFQADQQSLFDCKKYQDIYILHNKTVKDYFKHKSDALLVINPSESNSYLKLCDFLSKSPIRDKYPHVNRS